MLALGLYRSYKKPTTSKAAGNYKDNDERYVTTAPPYDAKLRANDKVTQGLDRLHGFIQLYKIFPGLPDCVV